MDIDTPRTFRWDAPAARTDGTPIRGTITYHFEFDDAAGDVIRVPAVGEPGISGTEVEIDFAALGFAPGDYTAYVRATEDYQGVGRVSGRSNGAPFVLERIAPPAEPANLRLSA